MERLEAGNRQGLEAFSCIQKQFSSHFTNFRFFEVYQIPILQMKFSLLKSNNLL